jgi:hypothetical protein
MTSPRTLLAALIEKPRGCNVHGDAEEPPVAILWTLQPSDPQLHPHPGERPGTPAEPLQLFRYLLSHQVPPENSSPTPALMD